MQVRKLVTGSGTAFRFRFGLNESSEYSIRSTACSVVSLPQTVGKYEKGRKEKAAGIGWPCSHAVADAEPLAIPC